MQWAARPLRQGAANRLTSTLTAYFTRYANLSTPMLWYHIPKINNTAEQLHRATHTHQTDDLAPLRTGHYQSMLPHTHTSIDYLALKNWTPQCSSFSRVFSSSMQGEETENKNVTGFLLKCVGFEKRTCSKSSSRPAQKQKQSSCYDCVSYCIPNPKHMPKYTKAKVPCTQDKHTQLSSFTELLCHPKKPC